MRRHLVTGRANQGLAALRMKVNTEGNTEQKLSAAPRVDQATGSFHRLPQWLRRSDEVFGRLGADAESRA
jgi:hypothetical protein